MHGKYILFFVPERSFMYLTVRCSDVRHIIIYDSNKAAVEISVPYEKCMRPENRRPNSYYLGSAESPTPDFF